MEPEPIVFDIPIESLPSGEIRNPAATERPLDERTYKVTLRTLRGREITLHVVDGKPATETDYHVAVITRHLAAWPSGSFWSGREYWKDDPRRPLRNVTLFYPEVVS